MYASNGRSTQHCSLVLHASIQVISDAFSYRDQLVMQDELKRHAGRHGVHACKTFHASDE